MLKKIIISLAAMLAGVTGIVAAPAAHANETYGGVLMVWSGRKVHVECLSGEWHWVYQNHLSPCKYTMAWVPYRDRRYVESFGPNFSNEHYGWVAPGTKHYIWRGRGVNVHACHDGLCKNSAHRF